jgi:hypothetical protein
VKYVIAQTDVGNLLIRKIKSLRLWPLKRFLMRQK